MTGVYGYDVCVGLCCGGVFVLGGENGAVDSCADGVVAVDNSEVNVGKNVGELLGGGLGYFEVLGVINDVDNGDVVAFAAVNGDETEILEEVKGAGFVGTVVGNSNLCAVGKSFNGSGLSGIYAERLIVDSSGGNDVGAVVGVVVVKVGLMLEVVGVDVAGGEGFVRKNVVGELDDFKV